MAEVQWEGRLVGLNFIVCGPSQAGKSTFLAALRAPMRAVDDGDSAIRCAPLELTGEVALGVVPGFLEVHPEVAVDEQATPLLASTDGVLFIADSRRERLRDDFVAWAWLLEHLRAAKRDDVPIVVAFHRRDAQNALPASDLDGALGVGRHPFFETERGNPGGLIAAVIELVRRAAARAHPAVEALWPTWQRGAFLGALDARLGECSSRVDNPTPVAAEPAAAAPAPAAPASDAAEATSTPVPATMALPPSTGARVSRRARRSPMLRFATHFFGEAGRVARERRRIAEQLACVVEDSRRPMAFLKTLFGHLQRERKRLPGPLAEGVAGGAEILKHLEDVLGAAARGLEATKTTRVRERPFDLEEALRAANSALRRDVTVPRARLRLAHLPTVRADAEAMSALLWAALGAVLRASRRRERRLATVRVSARERVKGLRIRFSRFDVARRGTGLDEILLARRLAERLGIGFAVVASRRGGHAIVLDLPVEMKVVEPTRSKRRREERLPAKIHPEDRLVAKIHPEDRVPLS